MLELSTRDRSLHKKKKKKAADLVTVLRKWISNKRKNRGLSILSLCRGSESVIKGKIENCIPYCCVEEVNQQYRKEDKRSEVRHRWFSTHHWDSDCC